MPPPRCLTRLRSYDEVKIKLPLALTSAHHILFTFLHVPGKTREAETVIGYSVLPVLSNEILMATKDNTLPVILDSLPPNYLSPEAEEHIKVRLPDPWCVCVCVCVIASMNRQCNRMILVFVRRMNKRGWVETPAAERHETR